MRWYNQGMSDKYLGFHTGIRLGELIIEMIKAMSHEEKFCVNGLGLTNRDILIEAHFRVIRLVQVFYEENRRDTGCGVISATTF